MEKCGPLSPKETLESTPPINFTANESVNCYSDTNTSSNFSQLQRSQSRSSNRLSGLKKLGSLYKTFKDDDEDFFSTQKSNRNCE